LKNIGEVSAEGMRFLGGYGGMLPRKFLKFGSLKWHLQHSESTFCKKCQVFKTLINGAFCHKSYAKHKKTTFQRKYSRI
jgi:hypothetical protein